jgi:hypothetical protein
MEQYELAVLANSLKEARAMLVDCGFYITVRWPKLQGDEYIFTVVV